ncbi:Protein of unknown function [Gryllus bimaculatus]|nr:Protein of unknown function [Gryllus bimaculatus]
MRDVDAADACSLCRVTKGYAMTKFLYLIAVSVELAYVIVGSRDGNVSRVVTVSQPPKPPISPRASGNRDSHVTSELCVCVCVSSLKRRFARARVGDRPRFPAAEGAVCFLPVSHCRAADGNGAEVAPRHRDALGCSHGGEFL